jgi:hypothetical protein
MKKSIHYIIGLLCFTLAFTACEKIEPDLFDKGANGAYFDYEYAADFDRTLNFSEYIVGNPDTVEVALKVKLLGYLMDDERTLAVKTKEIKGYELADVAIDKVVFSGKEYEKEIVVKVKRPAVEDQMYAVCIYLDGSGDLGTGISGRNEVNLYVTESYEQPAVWYSHILTYLGGWSKEKHIFLANHTGDNQFYTSLYDEEMGMHVFDAIVALNVSAVNALLASEPEKPIAVDLPILKETEYPAYNEPYFWNAYEEQLGAFRAGKFCRFTTMLGGSNTRDIAALFASDAAMQKMEEEKDNFHRMDVLEMLNEYYRYAMMDYPISEYKNLFWVELKNNVNYNVRIPFWWEDPNGLGTAEIVKKYFGEYSDDKYQFMLKTVMKEDGTENFIAASILPFRYDKELDAFGWDESLLGVKQLSGEERLKECYRMIKAANDKRPDSRKFDIPDVDVD